MCQMGDIFFFFKIQECLKVYPVQGLLLSVDRKTFTALLALVLQNYGTSLETIPQCSIYLAFLSVSIL